MTDNEMNIVKVLMSMDRGITKAFGRVSRDMRVMKKFRKQQNIFNMFTLFSLVMLAGDIQELRKKERTEGEN